MINHTKSSLLLIIFSLFLLQCLTGFNFIDDLDSATDETISADKFPKVKDSNSWTAPFIHIKNDNWSATPMEWIRVKSGTYNDPHIIENVSIVIQGLGKGILIENSCQHFVVRNCSVSSTEVPLLLVNNAAIKLVGVSNGTIRNSTLQSFNRYGLVANDCANISFSKNNVNNNFYGISLSKCHNFSLNENKINAIRFDAVSLSDCENITLKNNKIYDTEDSGIYFHDSYNSILVENELINCGIEMTAEEIENYTSHSIDSSNLVNSKPVYYYTHSDDLNNENFTNAGQIMLIDCNNLIISDLIISNTSVPILFFECENNTLYNVTCANNNNDGIVMEYCDNFTIYNTTFINSDDGLDMDVCHKGVFRDNIFNNNRFSGISLSDCNNNTVYRNNFTSNIFYGVDMDSGEYNNLTANNMWQCGIYIEGYGEQLSTQIIDKSNLITGKQVYYYVNENKLDSANYTNAGQIILVNSSDSIITDLNLSWGSIGILLINCRNLTISNIISSNNKIAGIYLEDDIYDSEFSHNTVNYNGFSGIVESGSKNCTFFENTANYNVYYGFETYSDNNSYIKNTANYNENTGIKIGGINNTLNQNTANNNPKGIDLVYAITIWSLILMEYILGGVIIIR